ncbi:flagellar hook assembly protein FlgD [Azospirillum halopraeferens]|uniref:flagellar hook assembly protein FlgD n=1 Tax=Azospirillum halopraeferens TaxID=34010 RepID=UPI0003FDA489|nr:flagellar hook capping FlgD N-terminal domain-containing protein [Azospirillum halopraeferens]
MQVDNNTATTQTASSTKSSSASLAENYQSFLTLLLKQLEVQDPTNPVDASQYTSQLVQLASLEQDVANGKKLDSLNSAVSRIGSGIAAIGYLGRTIEAKGDTTALQNGSATWVYELDSAAASVSLTVTDANGTVVYRADGETAQGSHTLTWDGTGSDGTKHSSGAYTLTVTARDASGATIGTETRIKGTVTSVDTSGSATTLSVGGVDVRIDDVVSLS